MKKLAKNDLLLFVLVLNAFGSVFLIGSGNLYQFAFWLAEKMVADGKVVFLMLGVLIMAYVLFVMVLFWLRVLPSINPKLADKLGL